MFLEDYQYGQSGPTISQRGELAAAGHKIVKGRKAGENSYYPADYRRAGYKEEAVTVEGRVFSLTTGKPAYHGEVVIVSSAA
jgi:hypothetical protein